VPLQGILLLFHVPTVLGLKPFRTEVPVDKSIANGSTVKNGVF
jgi:hypothetical protein